MTVFWLKSAGIVLLILVGFGMGEVIGLQGMHRWHQSLAFVRLLEFLARTLRCRALPCDELLALAAMQPGFASFHPESCRTLQELVPPPGLAAIYGNELREGLASVETSSRSDACRTLSALATLCRRETEEQQRRCMQTRFLAPRLGACLGLLAAVLLS